MKNAMNLRMWQHWPTIYLGIFLLILLSALGQFVILFGPLSWRLYNYRNEVWVSILAIFTLELLVLTLSIRKIDIPSRLIACFVIGSLGAAAVYGSHMVNQVMTALGSSRVVDSTLVDNRNLHLVLRYELETPAILQLYVCDGYEAHCTWDNIKVLVEGFSFDDNGVVQPPADIRFNEPDSTGNVNVVEDGKVIFIYTPNWIGH